MQKRVSQGRSLARIYFNKTRFSGGGEIETLERNIHAGNGSKEDSKWCLLSGGFYIFQIGRIYPIHVI
jgi:hypothetical protein